jgi:hypothetical protein
LGRLNYARYDPIVEAWSHRVGLPLLTQYQDDEVRAFEVVTPSGARRQIWLEVLNEGTDDVLVHVWDFRDRRETLAGDATTLETRLDQGLNLARGWSETG